MKQLACLMKKDLFLMGNYLYFIPAFTLALPFLYCFLIPEYATQKGTGLIVLIVSSVYSEFLAYEQIFLKDAEYPRALSLLCAAPYRRRDIISSRYLLFCLVFAATALIYTIPSLFLPSSFRLSFMEYAVAFLLNVLLFGFLTPLQHLFGFENSKFVPVLVIIPSCFLLPLLLKTDLLELRWLNRLPALLVFLLLLGVCVFLLFLSAEITIRIFQRKELM